MPVATATAKRSFSVMRRVKTHAMSTMPSTRLSSLSVLHAYTYKQWPIDTNKVIESFALKKTRRLAMGFFGHVQIFFYLFVS